MGLWTKQTKADILPSEIEGNMNEAANQPQKFSFRNLQAIFLRILYEPTLIEQFHTYIDPEKFTFGQNDPKICCNCRIVERY